MLSTDTLSWNPPAERIWFIRFANWYVCVTLITAIAACWLGVRSQWLPLYGGAVLALFCCGALLLVRRAAHADDLTRAALIVSVMGYLSTIAAAYILPATITGMIMVPMLALVVSLPHFRDRKLKLLIAGTIATIGLSIVVAERSPFRVHTVPEGFAVLIVITFVIVSMIGVRLWHYRHQLDSLMDNMVSGQQAIEDARGSLERQVEERTAEVRASEERYRMLTKHATDMISVHGPDGTFRYCSPAMERMLGYQVSEIIGTSPLDFIHPDDSWNALYRGKVHDTGAVTTHFRVRHKGGHYLWFETSARTVYDQAASSITEIVAITRDIDARKTTEHQIELLAYFDPLTQLANRRRFHDEILRALASAKQHASRTALLYLDLDGFKKVNDTLGHDAGDELLVQVAGRLRHQARGGDTLARLGGDEFALIMPDLTDSKPAESIAQRILDQFILPFELRGQLIHLGVSVGIACSPEDGTSADDLLKHADIAMYRAKSEGDSYQFYEPSLSVHNEERLRIDTELRHAIPHAELVLHYQPIRSLETGDILHVEALVRWNHPTRGLLQPGAFVPYAEESGLIRSLDRWVMRTALRQIAAWSRQGMALGVSINLSMRSFQDRDLVHYVQSCLEDTGAPASRVTIELTESAAMRDPQTTQEMLEQFKRLGLRIAIDDFGSGQTSLTYLKRLPVDIVKIDRAFIQGVTQDSKDEGVVRAIIALSKGLGVLVVAEGVTDESQCAWLQAAGCEMVQGFGIGMPAPAESVQRLLIDESGHAPGVADGQSMPLLIELARRDSEKHTKITPLR